jgi:D-lyxose ketol-isomerase
MPSYQVFLIDEKGTWKATEHNKYENIASSVGLSLFVGINGNAYYCPRRLAPG